MVESLANCPFCGSTEVEGMLAFSSPTEYFVGCNECHAQSALYDDPMVAIAAWNRRDYSHIEITDAMAEAGALAHCDHFGGEGWYSSGQAADSTEAMNAAMRLALTAALNVKEG